MQINSVGNAHNLLTGKIYSTGSVSKHLLEESDSARKLAAEKSKFDTDQKISDIVAASSKESLQVTNVDSLYAVDYDLKNMLGLAKYASGDISNADREKCEQEFGSYYSDIGTIDKSEQAALKKYYAENPEAAKAAVSASADNTCKSDSGYSSNSDAGDIMAEITKEIARRPTWYQTLGIDGVNVDTKENAADAVERIGGRYRAIDTVEDEIKELTKAKKTGTQIQQEYTLRNDTTVNNKSQAEYVTLLEANMQGDTDKAAVTGDTDASAAENLPGSSYDTTGISFDTVG